MSTKKKKTYSVCMPLSGYMTIKTQAFSREEAIQKFIDGEYEAGEPEDVDADHGCLEEDYISSSMDEED